jgi:glutathione S-transferase
LHNHYFIVRFLLEYLGLPYENKKYSKPEEWFGKDKLEFAAEPLANLPYIKDG